jgi:hypothetical protein
MFEQGADLIVVRCEDGPLIRLLETKTLYQKGTWFAVG